MIFSFFNKVETVRDQLYGKEKFPGEEICAVFMPVTYRVAASMKREEDKGPMLVFWADGASDKSWKCYTQLYSLIVLDPCGFLIGII